MNLSLYAYRTFAIRPTFIQPHAVHQILDFGS